MLFTNHQLDCIVLLWIHRCLPKQINIIPRSIVSAPIDDDEDSPVEEMSPVKAKKPSRRASKAKEKEPPKYWTTTKEITLPIRVSIKEDTAYSCLHSPKTTENKAQYAVSRETQYAVFKIWNEYNILEDIKRGPYSKKSLIRRIQLLGYAVWDNEDVHDLRSFETEFPTIVFNDTLTSEATLSCEPTVSSLNNDEIDFRIWFDESDDDDCTPTVSYFDDLDYFKDFENEFSAIVYNDAPRSKSDLLTELILSTQHINEFDLKSETSLSECDKEEQKVIYFNDLFIFNVIYPDDSKTDKNNDDDKIDIEHSSGDMSVIPLSNVINTDVGAYAHGSNKLLKISINTAYPGEWIRSIDFLYSLGPRERKIDDVGDVFTNLETLKCWSLETSRRLFNIQSCS
ncbi:hypothetical protein Tco_0024797 [Tanacetum coccineum]